MALLTTTTLIVYAITFLVTYFGLKLILRKRDYRKRPPCLFSLPIVGSLPFIPSLSKFHLFFQEKAKTLGNVIGFYMCNRYVIVLNGRNTINEAFLKQSLAFSDRPITYLTNEDAKGIAHHRYNEQFKILRKTSLNILKTFGFGQGIMESRIRIEVESLLKRFRLKTGQAFHPTYEISATVSNVINSIIFGKRWDIDDPEFQEGIEISKSLIRDLEKHLMVDFFPILRFIPYFREGMHFHLEARKRWARYLQSIVNSIPDMTPENCLYAALKEEMKMSNDESLQNDDEHLVVAIKDLFVGGTDTTATTLQWLIILMANNPDVQKRIRVEMDQLLGIHKHPSLDDKPNLPLLEAAILEVMRFKTLLPLFVPHSTLIDTYLDGMFIPANTLVLPNFYSCHMDPHIWKEPEKFNIDRFLDETKTKVINKEQVVSFSLGKRSCLGELLARQELFLFASALIHEFEIYPPIGEEMIDMAEEIALLNAPKPFKARFVTRKF